MPSAGARAVMLDPVQDPGYVVPQPIAGDRVQSSVIPGFLWGHFDEGRHQGPEYSEL